ncbi:phage protein, HK97 gp10 family [Moraxella lacunata]|uniref:Phage protein, HK97 gp10 family n=1 Tax=Moraxella lacunata TaxID=477 RepID=A0A378QDR7_MORLA|nr:HK97-gp10 family putative phage morphogenesis protein [Moraxella lacunata]STY99056.1 phage protein, HK97 gp10 family [Moraxella lacunata]
MQIKGLDELNKKLHQLRDEVSNKDAGGVLYGSLMFASTPMYKEARANAPFRTGVIKGSIKRRRLTKGDSANMDGAAVAIYVALKGSRKSRENAYYYIFHEEYGARGRPPIPFIRPAFDNNQAGATDRFTKKLGERIDKIMG